MLLHVGPINEYDSYPVLQISFNRRAELLEEILYPGAFETRSQIAEDLNEMKEQLRKQVARLRELRVKKVEEPGMLRTAE